MRRSVAHDVVRNPETATTLTMKREAATPADYLTQVPEVQRPLIDVLRSAILSIDPDLEEGVRYGMLDYPGLANLAAQKSYVALYVMPAVLAKFTDRFPGVSCGKSCLRFHRLDQINEAVLVEMLQAVRGARRSDEAG